MSSTYTRYSLPIHLNIYSICSGCGCPVCRTVKVTIWASLRHEMFESEEKRNIRLNEIARECMEIIYETINESGKSGLVLEGFHQVDRELSNEGVLGWFFSSAVSDCANCGKIEHWQLKDNQNSSGLKQGLKAENYPIILDKPETGADYALLYWKSRKEEFDAYWSDKQEIKESLFTKKALIIKRINELESNISNNPYAESLKQAYKDQEDAEQVRDDYKNQGWLLKLNAANKELKIINEHVSQVEKRFTDYNKPYIDELNTRRLEEFNINSQLTGSTNFISIKSKGPAIAFLYGIEDPNREMTNDNSSDGEPQVTNISTKENNIPGSMDEDVTQNTKAKDSIHQEGYNDKPLFMNLEDTFCDVEDLLDEIYNEHGDRSEAKNGLNNDHSLNSEGVNKTEIEYCPFCGTKLIVKDASFCHKCGKQIPKL